MSFEEAEHYAQQAKPEFHAGIHLDPDSEESPIAQVSAAIYVPDGVIEQTVSSFYAVKDPGSEESYDTALADAAAEAKERFIAYMADKFDLGYRDAEDIVDVCVTNPDLPIG